MHSFCFFFFLFLQHERKWGLFCGFRLKRNFYIITNSDSVPWLSEKNTGKSFRGGPRGYWTWTEAWDFVWPSGDTCGSFIHRIVSFLCAFLHVSFRAFLPQPPTELWPRPWNQAEVSLRDGWHHSPLPSVQRWSPHFLWAPTTRKMRTWELYEYNTFPYKTCVFRALN